MRKFRKLYNLALVFAFMGMYLCQSTYALRVPMGDYQSIKDVQTLASNENTEDKLSSPKVVRYRNKKEVFGIDLRDIPEDKGGELLIFETATDMLVLRGARYEKSQARLPFMRNEDIRPLTGEERRDRMKEIISKKGGLEALIRASTNNDFNDVTDLKDPFISTTLSLDWAITFAGGKAVKTEGTVMVIRIPKGTEVSIPFSSEQTVLIPYLVPEEWIVGRIHLTEKDTNNPQQSREKLKKEIMKIVPGLNPEDFNRRGRYFTTSNTKKIWETLGVRKEVINDLKIYPNEESRDLCLPLPDIVDEETRPMPTGFNVEIARDIATKSISGELELFSKECFDKLKLANAMYAESYRTNMVVNKDGNGILIIGPQGSGKTLLTHLFQELNPDYSFMADDSVYLMYPFDYESEQPNYEGPLYAFPRYPGQKAYGFRGPGRDSKDEVPSDVRKIEPDLVQVKLVIVLRPVKGIKAPAYYLKKEKLDERIAFFNNPHDNFWDQFSEALSIAPFFMVYLTPETTTESYKKVISAVSEYLNVQSISDRLTSVPEMTGL